ncbi:MAG: hypothetical protein Q8M20_17885 [Rhodocyclaceae bacterium]|nr:hypothetical protein [Rhodocyclaceae bacterium]MDZ4213732.1 hypothetical protein [Rhodocyclaceae bacterium]
MTEFAKNNPIKSRFWAEVDDLNLLQAALLTFGIEPFSLDDYWHHTGERVTLDDLPSDFLLRIEALRSSIRTNTLRANALNYDDHMRIDENETRIKTDDFVAWCNAKRLPHNIPGRTVPQTTKWPWGDYETDLLRMLASAAEEWWSTYDPASPATAPTNQEVKDWLVGQGVSDRIAESMATILRADGLATGPRRP